MSIESVAELIKKHKSGERWLDPRIHYNVDTIYEIFDKIRGGNVIKLKITPDVYDIDEDMPMPLEDESSFIIDIREGAKTDYTLKVIVEGEYEDADECENEEDYYLNPFYTHIIEITLHFTGHNKSASLFDVKAEWIESDSKSGKVFEKDVQDDCELMYDKAYSESTGGGIAAGISLNNMLEIRFNIEEICESTLGKDGKPEEVDEKKISGTYNLIFRNVENTVRGKLRLDALLFGGRMDITISGDNGVMKCHHFFMGRIEFSNGCFLGYSDPVVNEEENAFYESGMLIYFDFLKKPYAISGKIDYAKTVQDPDDAYKEEHVLLERWILETEFKEGGQKQDEYVNIAAGNPQKMEYVFQPGADQDITGAADIGGGSTSTIGGPSDLGEHITRDGDGDLYVHDPVTGDEILYRADGDGTYTNPLTDSTYTAQELKNLYDSRAENQELLQMDYVTAQHAVKEQSEANQYLSQDGQEYLRQKWEDEKKLNKEIQLDHAWIKYGGERGNEESIRNAMGEHQKQNEQRQQDAHAYATKMDYIVKGLEYTQTAADIGVDVLAGVTGQQGIKNAYTIGKNMASRMSDAYVNNKGMTGAIVMAGVDSITDLGLGKVEDAGFEVVGNAGAELIKNTAQNVYEGKKWNEGWDKAALTGAGKGLVSKISNAFTGSQEAVTKEQLQNDLNLIRTAAQNNVSEKSLQYLQDIRIIDYINNVNAEKTAKGAAALVGDVVNLGIDAAAGD